MNLVEGVVERVFINEAREGKFGKYWPQAIVVDGRKFSKTTKTSTPIANQGDTVKFVFQAKTSADGKEYLNITEHFEVVKANTAHLDDGVALHTIVHPYKQTQASAPTPKQGFDTKGVKIGHAITNAVNLVVARFSTDGLIKLEDDELKNTILGHAKLILEISEELNNESN